MLRGLSTILGALMVLWCRSPQALPPLVVGLSADYPPMEFREGEVFQGFDVDLARLIADALGREVIFKDIPFSGLFPSLNTGQIDMAISSITVNPERRKNFDFSDIYYAAELALVFHQDHTPPLDLKDARIGCQSGSTMASWAQEHAPGAITTFMDLNPPLIEALKAGHLDGVILEQEQALAFCKDRTVLVHRRLGQADQGYAIAFKKGSGQVAKINALLKNKQDDITNLRLKWKLP